MMLKVNIIIENFRDKKLYLQSYKQLKSFFNYDKSNLNIALVVSIYMMVQYQDKQHLWEHPQYDETHQNQSLSNHPTDLHTSNT
jgi:hypothetical protein